MNLFGGGEKSDYEKSADAADYVEALKAEFVRRADELKAGDLTSSAVSVHQAKVEEWVHNLHLAYQSWVTKGSKEWPGVKRIQYVDWWVDQPEGRNALLR